MRIKNVLSAVMPMALAVALVTGCGAKRMEKVQILLRPRPQA